jgi:hypothetical protein
MLAEAESPRIAQAWMQGLNPQLDDRSHASLLRDGDVDEVGPAVIGARLPHRRMTPEPALAYRDECAVESLGVADRGYAPSSSRSKRSCGRPAARFIAMRSSREQTRIL